MDVSSQLTASQSRAIISSSFLLLHRARLARCPACGQRAMRLGAGTAGGVSWQWLYIQVHAMAKAIHIRSSADIAATGWHPVGRVELGSGEDLWCIPATLQLTACRSGNLQGNPDMATQECAPLVSPSEPLRVAAWLCQWLAVLSLTSQVMTNVVSSIQE